MSPVEASKRIDARGMGARLVRLTEFAVSDLDQDQDPTRLDLLLDARALLVMASVGIDSMIEAERTRKGRLSVVK